MPPHSSKSATAPSFEEWRAAPVIQSLVTSEMLGWKDMSLMTSQVIASEDDVEAPLNDTHFLVVELQGSTQHHSRFDGKIYDEYLVPGAMMLVPAGYQMVGRWSHSITAAFVQLSPRVTAAVAEADFSGDPAHQQLLPLINFRDPLLYYLTMALYDELQNPGPLGTLFSDSVSQTIMLHLIRKYSNKTLNREPARSQLTTWQMRKLNDYVDQHLDQKISLSNLASLLNLSVSHFERSFRVSQGCSPYRYVLQRRMERAQQLLRSGKLPVYEVARQCGFANQSHFTRHFTRFVGISPARFAALAKK